MKQDQNVPQKPAASQKIAWSADLGGLPVDVRVTKTLEAQREVFEDLGCIVEEGFPDFSDADEIFKTFRAWFYEMNHGSLLREHRDKMKATKAKTFSKTYQT